LPDLSPENRLNAGRFKDFPAASIRPDFNHCHRNWLVFFQNTITVQSNMSERENNQLRSAERTVRSRISVECWEQIKTAHASGIGLREIARNMGIPEGTVLARAKREGWSRQVNNAKALAQRDDAAKAIAPFEAASATMQQRGERSPCGLSDDIINSVEDCVWLHCFNVRQSLFDNRNARQDRTAHVWPFRW
jgi:hypothetical protein